MGWRPPPTDRHSHKGDPLAVATVQQLIGYLLPPGATVNLSTGRPRWFLQRRHRRVGADVVAAQFLELAVAGGRDGFSKVGCEWNCRHRVFGFDIDHEAFADHDGRGCNHPDNDGGNAVQRLQELVHELTGGELILTINPESGGIWLLGIAPSGVDAELLAQDLLRQMAAEGFHIGKGRLELPLNNARLPLAGYVLQGHEHRCWIDQVGELVSWMDEQSTTVNLRRPLSYTTKQLEIPTPFDPGQAFDRAGVTIQNLRWLPEHRSNGFLGACAMRMAKAGHGAGSTALMASLVEAHPDWIANASAESRKGLIPWCARQLRWAERNIKAEAAKPAGLSNAEKYQRWCDGVRAGVANAVKHDKTRITEVINHLVANGYVGSKRICWARRDLIEDGIERELLAAETAAAQGCLEVTTTQLIPMGVTASEPVADGSADGCSGSELSKSAVPIPPIPSAESGSCGVPVETKADPRVIGQIRSNFAELRDQMGSWFQPVQGKRGSPGRERAADPEKLTPIKPGRSVVLSPEQRRERERAELAAWIADTA